MKNILFILTDQQRADTIHALGNDDIITPALDSLACTSSVFEKCYTPSPICVPARLSLLSGLYPAKTGNNTNNCDKSYTGKGFYSRFTENGWNTCAIGKMHNITDLYGDLGFKQRFTQEEMAHEKNDYMQYLHRTPYNHVYDFNGQRSDMYYMPQVSQLPMEVHPTQWVGDRSVEFIKDADPETPLFLMSSFIHPHPPFAAPSPWNKMYRNPIRRSFTPENPEDYIDLLRNGHVLKAEGISERNVEMLTAYYYACISFVDYQISRIIQALKDKGIYDDTLIVFSSDHGELLGDYGSMGKRTMLDASARIPFMIHTPGQKDQKIRKDPASLVDLAPTLLSYAGIEYDREEYDGIDLFNGKHELVYSQYASGTQGEWMVASSMDKLIYSAVGDRYFYFKKFPDEKDCYSEGDERCRYLKKLLDDYIASDVNSNPETKPMISPARKPPLSFYSPIQDHLYTRNEEFARMPEGYPIILGDKPTA